MILSTIITGSLKRNRFVLLTSYDTCAKRMYHKKKKDRSKSRRNYKPQWPIRLCFSQHHLLLLRWTGCESWVSQVVCSSTTGIFLSIQSASLQSGGQAGYANSGGSEWASSIACIVPGKHPQGNEAATKIQMGLVWYRIGRPYSYLRGICFFARAIQALIRHEKCDMIGYFCFVS